MNHSLQSITLIVVFSMVLIQGPRAQAKLDKWQLGINGGMLIYQGDLAPSDIGSYRTIKPAFGVYVSRVLNPSLALRTNLAIGSFYGNDSRYNTPLWRHQRNFNFTSPLAELSELLVWNISGNNGNELGQRFSPYVFGGLGVSFLHISRDYSRFNDHYFARATNILNGIAADSSHSLPGAIPVIPVGLGMEFYLSSRLSLTAETSFRFTFTDYLDGFKYGANPAKKDFYYSHTVGLLYRFGKHNNLDCPVIKR